MYQQVPSRKFLLTIYEVWEQWPHCPIASFFELQDAVEYVRVNRDRLALPLINSHIVMPTVVVQREK